MYPVFAVSMIQVCSVEARPPGIYFWPLREGEKVSESGVESFGGEVCWGGRRKWGRVGAGVAVFRLVEVAGVVVWKRWGVRGAGVRKRCVFDAMPGVRGGCGGIEKVDIAVRGWEGDVGSVGERRRRLLAFGLEWGASKSISASSSSSSALPRYLPCIECCSIDCAIESSKSPLP